MDFLPQDYETPQGGGSYMKLQQGENKFRILSKPIIGWLDWKDKTPHRFTMKNKPEKPFDPSKPIRHFWAMLVFDYADKSIKILEITQNTIQKAIEHLAKDEDWGNPADYKVNPSPKKSLSDEIKEAAKAKPVNLEALYKGGDPFNIQNGEQTQLIFESLPF
jgi:hypothetical protein